MDPMITPIVIILGKYALDKGAELAKEVGPKALETAKEMFQTVLERVGQKKPETAAEFPNDPETYQKPLEKALEAETQADPDLAAQLKALLQEYEKAAQAHAAVTSQTYQATVSGSGAVAQDHSVAAGEGGLAIKGDVHGGITVGRCKEPKE
jgi:rhamnose utilization protein RhaD (predicted bifunctional aldolase and dehydrogenase)